MDLCNVIQRLREDNNTSYYGDAQRKEDENANQKQKNEKLLRAAASGQLIRLGHLKVGADFDYEDENGWTALHMAAFHRYDKVAEALIQAGADVNARSKDDSL